MPDSEHVTDEACLVSIIVPAYNAAQTIQDCLNTLFQQSVERDCYEIIVVDDGSTDATPDIVTSYSSVRLIRQANAGPAVARNRGAQEARGEILLFTDADCVPAHDWIERMIAPFQRSDVKIVGVKGTYLSCQRALTARFVQLEYEDKYRRMARFEYIDFIDTYSAGYRRDVFLTNGGFDTSFPTASVEDQEFSFRLARRGHKMVFVPEAHVYHLGHADTLSKYLRKKFKIGYWKVLVHKWHPDKMLADTHTPQMLKIQLLLAAVFAILLMGGMVWHPLWWGALAVGSCFLLTTLPFVWRALRQDVTVALLAPALLFLRAWGLGLGFAAGLFHFLILPRNLDQRRYKLRK
jgi:glycosyltransferase involved in cell wall biosynthesis